MNDRDLIIKAAKAIGLVGEWCENVPDFYGTIGNHFLIDGGCFRYSWNPLECSSNAFMLQTQLHMRVFINKEDATTTAMIGNMSSDVSGYALEHHKGDVMKATMRAITRCAADIVKED